MVCVSLLGYMLPEGGAYDCPTHSRVPTSGPLQALTKYLLNDGIDEPWTGVVNKP